MQAPVEKRDVRLMQALFSRIAPRYDFITRALSYGLDRRWKRLGIRMAALPDRPVVLDLAAGSGDFSRLVLEHFPHAAVAAADLTEAMLRRARSRGVARAVCADAGRLPFPARCFDAVFVGYGLRNFADLEAALREIRRVMRPGGQLVSLDFFLPRSAFLRRFYLDYLYLAGAFWGFLLHGRPEVYTYIAASLRSFISLEQLSARLLQAGFEHVESRGYIFGGIGIHWAAKRG